jgi:hypothetical protein
MLGQGAFCSVTGSNTGPVLDASVIHFNETTPGQAALRLKDCADLVTKDVTVAPPSSDVAITAHAKRTLGAYPMPYNL